MLLHFNALAWQESGDNCFAVLCLLFYSGCFSFKFDDNRNKIEELIK